MLNNYCVLEIDVIGLSSRVNVLEYFIQLLKGGIRSDVIMNFLLIITTSDRIPLLRSWIKYFSKFTLDKGPVTSMNKYI